MRLSDDEKAELAALLAGEQAGVVSLDKARAARHQGAQLADNGIRDDRGPSEAHRSITA
jgi:hypothetical protein